MKTIRNIKVPTGNILIVQGERGALEMLSLGDYGKDVNLKADCLGLDRELGTVEHTALLPLSKKWVVTISTQYGCSMGCTFCDVPKVGPGKNATIADLRGQVETALALHPEVTGTRRLNIHFARMGEPSWNPAVLDAAIWLRESLEPKGFKVHPVVSTMFPRRNEWLKHFIHAWMRIKNILYLGNAGLQISVNSTSEREREEMFRGNACTLTEISRIMQGIIPSGRKVTLNFALAGYEIDPAELLRYFDPRDYICKITPMHKTREALYYGIRTAGDYTAYYPYRQTEAALKAAGYDVLVFIASREEDEGRITCGNAILSGTEPFDLREQEARP